MSPSSAAVYTLNPLYDRAQRESGSRNEALLGLMNADYLFVPFTPDWERRRDYHNELLVPHSKIWSIYVFITCGSSAALKNLK